MNKILILEPLLQHLDEAKSENLKVYNVSEHVSYTDYVIILTALSSSHVRALMAKTEEYFKSCSIKPFLHTRKQDNYQWVVLDYGSIVIHYFQKKEREYYQLDQYFQKLISAEKILSPPSR